MEPQEIGYPRFSFGKTVSDMFSIIGGNVIVMTVLAVLLSGVPSAIFSVIWLQAMGSVISGGLLDYSSMIGEFGLLFGLGWLLVTLCAVFAQTALSWVSLRALDNENPTVGQALAGALRYFLPVLGITLIYYFVLFVVMALPVMAIFGLTGLSMADGFANPAQMVGAGLSIFLLMFFVVIPFLLFLMVIWIAAVPAAIQEGMGPIGALRRSWTLTSGHRWKILAMILIFFFVLMFVSGALSAVTMPMMAMDMESGGNPFSGMSLTTAIQSLLGSLTLIITYPALAATYHNLRIAREGVPQESVSDIFE